MTCATCLRSPRRSVLGGLLAVLILGMLAVPAPARADTIGNAKCATPTTEPGGSGLQLCSTSMYGQGGTTTHLLGFIFNPGAAVETPSALLTVNRADGKVDHVQAYAPATTLPASTATLFDYQYDGAAVSSFTVTGLSALKPTNVLVDSFPISNIVFGSASDTSVLTGTITNATKRNIFGIKLGYVAFDSAGRIAWYQPAIATYDNNGFPPGGSSSFVIPRGTIPSYAVLDSSAPFIYSSGNEPNGTIATAPSVAPGGSSTPVKRTKPTATIPKGHTPTTDTGLGVDVRVPTAQDIAEAANPGTVTPSHDAKPAVRKPAGALPVLLDAAPSSSKSSGIDYQTYAPAALLLIAALLAFRMLGRDAAAAREARSQRRIARSRRGAPPRSAEQASAPLPPGMVISSQPDLAQTEYTPPVSRKARPGG